MANAMMTIHPYFDRGDWVFDDESVGLKREPFVFGVPEMINEFVKNIPGAAWLQADFLGQSLSWLSSETDLVA